MTNYRVGFFQNQPAFGDVAHNLDEAESAIRDMEADLIVLPELFQTGYQFSSKEEANQLAEPITGPIPGLTTDRLTKLAKQKNCLPKVVIPVHLAGQSCDMKAIHELSKAIN